MDRDKKDVRKEKPSDTKDSAPDLTKELEDSFPASDPPSSTQPGSGVTGAEVRAPKK